MARARSWPLASCTAQHDVRLTSPSRRSFAAPLARAPRRPSANCTPRSTTPASTCSRWSRPSLRREVISETRVHAQSDPALSAGLWLAVCTNTANGIGRPGPACCAARLVTPDGPRAGLRSNRGRRGISAKPVRFDSIRSPDDPCHKSHHQSLQLNQTGAWSGKSICSGSLSHSCDATSHEARRPHSHSRGY